MYDELRERAIRNLERNRRKTRAMQVIAVLFGSIAIFLFFIRYFMFEGDRVYMFIPIAALGLMYGIIHTAVLGFPFVESNDITEEDIESEVIKVFRRSKSSSMHKYNAGERLELRQIEMILEEDDEFV